jgi:hypothetical protein
MPQPSSNDVIAVVQRLEAFLNESEYIPATNFHRSKVLLALLSKALTMGRAICTLVDAGFAGEAFGLSRTLIEIFLTIRYISNKDAEKRAKEYVEYVAKTQEYVLRMAAKHLPGKVLPQLDQRFVEMAKQYPSPHSWFQSHGGHVKAMAMEPDTYEVDGQGNPITQDFDYEHVYSQTSHFVHATIISLMGHGVNAGEQFRVRANISQQADRGNQALFNVLVFISKSFVCAFRGLQDNQPADILEEMRALTSSYAAAPPETA